MPRKTNSTYQPQQLLNFRKNIYLDQESTTPGTRATSGMRDDFLWHTKWFDAHPKSPEESYCWCSQWRLRHSDSSSSAQFVDYALYCRTWACLLCIFVPPRTSLIKFVNSGSLHWVLSLFIYFRSMFRFSRSFCRWSESKNIIRSRRSLENFRSSFTWAHPSQPELPYSIKHYFKYLSYQIGCFYDAMDLHFRQSG